MQPSRHIAKAQALIDKARGSIVTVAERTQRASALAALLLKEARRRASRKERRLQRMLARMMVDPSGRALTTELTDQSFRSHSPRRIANQMKYLLEELGVPRYFNLYDRFRLHAFRLLSPLIPSLLVPLATYMMRKEMAPVIIPGEPVPLRAYLKKRRAEGVRVNLNHLGEHILGEEEAKARLKLYLEDLRDPLIDTISVKISAICSQIHPLAWDALMQTLQARLQLLYKTAMEEGGKFVYLDMESFQDLHLTVALFRSVLSQPDFQQLYAGIALQAYLPDSYYIQREITEWAMRRVQSAGAPIKIRIVRGANLAMEQVQASISGWPQTPYSTKHETDGNFKRMITYAAESEHAKAAHVAVGSHNLFDIAYALLLRAESQVEPYVSFEMLEGMADPMRRALQQLTGDVLLYAPAARAHEFQSAVAYLIRRLDENTGAENFLRDAFDLTPKGAAWKTQKRRFQRSCAAMDAISAQGHRQQNRFAEPEPLGDGPFQNEPDTDWSLPHHRRWARQILMEWKDKDLAAIPLVIGGKELLPSHSLANGEDPSTGKARYAFAKASWKELDLALSAAKRLHLDVRERSNLLACASQHFRSKRSALIGAMCLDGGKIVPEADREVSEAIDFIEYYRRCMEQLESQPDVHFQPRGTFLVAPPWNFPCAIPTSAIASCLMAGNAVLFKPAPETVLVGWTLANLFWDAGVPKESLQFFACSDEPVGSKLLQDPRLSGALLTGAADTARKFRQLNPHLYLMAETGGKNALLISNLADRDLAISDLIQSAFGHAGQKCSAASLAILHKELYDDPEFMQRLSDACRSLRCGSAFELATQVPPLIRPPADPLLTALTSLDPGEEWLVKPACDPHNPRLWSPGIKLGVKPNSRSHLTEFFGPILCVMRAESLEEAIKLANAVPYGLTGGIHSLDAREISTYLEGIEVGNAYVNRTITGAIVRRQPFGGCKESSFGPGAKVGGSNFLGQLLSATGVGEPAEQAVPARAAQELIDRWKLNPEEMRTARLSAGSYSYWWSEMQEPVDESCLLGQDNYFGYAPRAEIIFRIQDGDEPLLILQVLLAAATCGAALEISCAPSLTLDLPACRESEEALIRRLGKRPRLRLVSQSSAALIEAVAAKGGFIDSQTPLCNGRFELLRYLREETISIDYHRYGYLGLREAERDAPNGKRAPRAFADIYGPREEIPKHHKGEPR